LPPPFGVSTVLDEETNEMGDHRISPHQRGKRATDLGREASVKDRPLRTVPRGPSTSDDEAGVSGIVEKADRPSKPPLRDNG
jgi:hypothetical protein